MATATAAAAAAPVGALTGTSAANAQSTPTRPPGVVPPDRPFAALPFSRRVARQEGVRLTNTWETAENERGIVGEGHSAIDLEAPYGTPVLAPCDGWAAASLQSYVARDGGPFNPSDPSNLNTKWRDPHTGREGYLAGAGLFIEFQMDANVPGSDQNYAAQLFHLSAFNPEKVAWLPPSYLGDHVTWDGDLFPIWYPDRVVASQAEIREIGKWVKRGEVIGYTGDSGIGFGWYDELNPETGVIEERDREALPPWDPQGVPDVVPAEEASMVHMQVYGGRDANNSKIFTFDCLDQYHRIEGEPGIPLDEIRPGPMSMFERKGRRGRLLYADEC